MKLEIDSDNWTDEIVQKLAEKLKPMLSDSKRDEETIFTVKTLAEYLTLPSRQSIYDKVRDNRIPHIKMGKLLRFKKSEIDKWLDRQNVPVVKDCRGR